MGLYPFNVFCVYSFCLSLVTVKKQLTDFDGIFCSNTALKSLVNALHCLRFLPCLGSKSSRSKCGTYSLSVTYLLPPFNSA